MRTLECVNENWNEKAPTYENLCDKSTMEWNMAEEIADVKKELQSLVELSEMVHTKFVNGLQYGHITTWKEVADMLVEWSDELEAKMEAIADRLY